MKKLWILGILAMFLIVGGVLVYAATITRPTSGATVTGNQYPINITSTLWNVSNCSVTFASTTHGVSINLVNTTNATSAQDDEDFGNISNGTIDSVALPDATDWAITGTCYNATDSDSITSITVIVDNQVPTCTFNSAFTSDSTLSTGENWTITGVNATSAKIRFGENSYLTMTLGNVAFTNLPCCNNVYNYDASLIPWDEGSYTVTAEVNDGTDTATCSLTNINLDDDTAKKKIILLPTGEDIGITSSGGQEVIKIGNFEISRTTALLILAIAIIAIWYSKKK